MRWNQNVCFMVQVALHPFVLPLPKSNRPVSVSYLTQEINKIFLVHLYMSGPSPKSFQSLQPVAEAQWLHFLWTKLPLSTRGIYHLFLHVFLWHFCILLWVSHLSFPTSKTLISLLLPCRVLISRVLRPWGKGTLWAEVSSWLSVSCWLRSAPVWTSCFSNH